MFSFQMIKKYYFSIFLCLTMAFMAGCGHGKVELVPPIDDKPEEVDDYKDGFTLSTKTVEADKPLTIIFKAAKQSSLYGYTGKVYAHIGLTEASGSSDWYNVLAPWDQNISKLEMKPVEGMKYTWQITLNPTVRNFFGVSAKEVMPCIALIVRSADGARKGVDEDFFIPIAGQEIQHAPTQMKLLPDGMRLGINHHGEGKVTFVLDDLDKKGQGYDAAYLLGSFNGWQRLPKYQMYRDPNKKWLWLTLDHLKAGEEYAMVYALYARDKVVRTSDPYSEKVKWGIPQARSAATLFTSVPEPEYQWQNSNLYTPVPKSQLMIYEMHLRDFTPEGNLAGAMKRLDYIQSLGFNAIELMPVQEFDGDDSWGYNPNHFFAMDQAYGSVRDYKDFIDECHRRGLAVIFDIVYNHATNESPFFKLYHKGNKPSENNPWMNVNAPHPYSVFNDFNHEEPRVREHFKRNLKFLLEEYHVDGFRFDLTKGLTQKVSNESNASAYDASRVAILSDYAMAAQSVKPDVYLILEHFCDDREETELAKKGIMLWRNLNHQFAQSAMGWQEASGLDRLYTPQVVDGWVGYMESHDEERVAFKQKTYGVSAVKQSATIRRERLGTNAAFFFMVPGPKMVWQFGEAAYDHSIEENGRTGRKPVFTEMQFKEVERAQLIKTYSRLLQLRTLYPEFWALDAPFTWQVAETDWNRLRKIELTSGGMQIKVFGNFNPSLPLEVPMPEGTWYNLMDEEQAEVSSMKLEPGQFLLIANFKVTRTK